MLPPPTWVLRDNEKRDVGDIPVLLEPQRPVTRLLVYKASEFA